MRVLLLVALMVVVVASQVFADSATIEKGEKGVSISISGSRKKQPAPPVPAKVAARKAEVFPDGMYERFSAEEKGRADVIRDVMAEYAAKNHYSKLSETQCKQMSEAIWFRLTSKGVPARLATGNVQLPSTGAGLNGYLATANHAWVMAEVSDGKWLALEATNGTVINKRKSPFHYTSAVFFDRPENVYRFDGLRRQWQEDRRKLLKLTKEWNLWATGVRTGTVSEQKQARDRLSADISAVRKRIDERYATLQSMYKRGMALR